MCMTIKEMNETMEAIQEWKRIKEQAEDNISALNAKVIDFLQETEECEKVKKKGSPVHVAPACAGSGKGPTTLASALSLRVSQRCRINKMSKRSDYFSCNGS